MRFRQIKFTNCACARRNKVCQRRRGRFRTARSGKVWYQPVQRTGELSAGAGRRAFSYHRNYRPGKGARVHLAMPKPSLFVREQKSPSASVTVNLLPGRALDEGQISAIVHLVSSAVAGLPHGNVTLVDQGGHLLTQSNTSGRDLNDAQLKYASDVEGRIQRRIEAILSPIVGNGNIHARSRRNWTSPVKNKRKNSIALTVMNLMRRFVHASLMRASKAVPVIRAAYRERCRINRHLRITRQSARLRQIKITASSRRAPPAIVGRVAHSGMKPVTTKSIAPFVIPK